MNVTRLEIPTVLLIEQRVFADHRGCFGETFREDDYASAGARGPFVQDNVAYSTRHVLRGLHFQHPNGQAKLVWAIRGEVFDVAVDVRVGSPTFGRAVSTVLSSENHRQLYIPLGFAHGYVVTSDDAIVAYKCSDYYAPASERSIRWDDPELGIRWPVSEPVLSPKDQIAPFLRAVPLEHLPRWE